jgi:hypothetical protein
VANLRRFRSRPYSGGGRPTRTLSET